MKNSKNVKILLFATLMLGALLGMCSCMKAENYYEKKDICSFMTELETKILSSEVKLQSEIVSLKNDYIAKVNTLNDVNEARKTEIANLTEIFNDNMRALETSEKALTDNIVDLKLKHEEALAEIKRTENNNVQAIAELAEVYSKKIAELQELHDVITEEIVNLKSEYELKISEIQELILADAKKIATLENKLEARIAEVKSDYNAKISNINELITALEQVDIDNVKRIAELEAKIESLLSKHEHKFDEWMDYKGNGNLTCSERLFYRICTECNAFECKIGEGHTTCGVGYCIVCNESIKYTVTFDTAGAGEIDSIKVAEGSLITRPNVFRGENFLLSGWYIDGTDVKWDFNKMTVTGDIKLKASWYVFLPPTK